MKWESVFVQRSRPVAEAASTSLQTRVAGTEFLKLRQTGCYHPAIEAWDFFQAHPHREIMQPRTFTGSLRRSACLVCLLLDGFTPPKDSEPFNFLNVLTSKGFVRLPNAFHGMPVGARLYPCRMER